MRSKRLVALVFVLALVAAACGQKEGVHVAADQGGAFELGNETTGNTNTGAAAGGADESLGGDASGGGGQRRTVTRGGGGGGDAAPTGGSAEAPQGGGDTGEAAAAGGGQLQAQGSDRTGVGEDAITIAIHAPVTGAAPLPATSFEKFGDLYWRYVTEMQGEKVLGKSKVNVVFRDDKYNPSSARQVCRELASSSFLLVGGGGTDQIQACGDLSNAAGVPYLSAGVTERGLRDLPWYYATSMSYKQQADLLAQYVKANLDGKTAMIATDTPNFDDAVEGWEEAVSRHGIDSGGVLRHPKGDTSWYNTFGNKLQSSGVKNLYMLTSPVDYIQFAQQNNDAGFQYIGVGITMGLNAILPTGCDDVDGGIFFSPFYGLDTAEQQVPEFFQAGQDLTGSRPDDIALAIWSINAAIHEMFKRYEATFGNDLTREDFRALLEQQQGIKTKVGPQLDYAPDDHFGANQVHVIQADCANEQYVTLDTFKSSF